MSDFFVLDNVRHHTILRALAAFVVGPYMVYVGLQTGYQVLTVFGLLTILVDTYTFYKSTQLALNTM